MKFYNKSLASAVTALAILLNAPVHAAEDKMTEEQVKTSIENYEKTGALGMLHHVNQKEIQMAKMALDKSQSVKVKDFAQKIVSDHQGADKKVVDLADAESVKLPDFQLSGVEKAKNDLLDKMKGNQFDLAYLLSMDGGHKMVAQDLDMMRGTVKDPQILALIDGILPSIREHQKLAASLGKAESQMAGTVNLKSN